MRVKRGRERERGESRPYTFLKILETKQANKDISSNVTNMGDTNYDMRREKKSSI